DAGRGRGGGHPDSAPPRARAGVTHQGLTAGVAAERRSPGGRGAGAALQPAREPLSRGAGAPGAASPELLTSKARLSTSRAAPVGAGTSTRKAERLPEPATVGKEP